MELTPQQQDALASIIDFATDASKSVFILKGYAGTGKTTMIKHVVPELHKLGKCVRLMAPTGRAAKVLQDKTGYLTSTVHRAIYSFGDIKVELHDEVGKPLQDAKTPAPQREAKTIDDVQFSFKLREHDDENHSQMVYIVDESSMVSSHESNTETLRFGSGVLLDDLLTYAQLLRGAKIIFVGDPAQLPPVGDSRSAALEESFFIDKGLGVVSFELTDVIRQGGDSAILGNAMRVRHVLRQPLGERNELCFERKSGEVEDIAPEQIADTFFAQTPEPTIGDAVVIAFSNAQVKVYNDALHSRYFPDSQHVQQGDVLQVVRNNYNADLDVALFNGDFVKVLSASGTAETISAPVWTDVAGVRKRLTVTLEFRDVILLTQDGKQVHCKILDTLLNSGVANLSKQQYTAIYVDFKIRNSSLKPNEKAFKESLMRDPYYNAVQVKYGYAITGHKAQGGEWKTVYADYSCRTGLKDDPLRWTYTVTPRASQTLYGANMPSITPLSGIKFREISKVSKASPEAFAYAELADVRCMPATAKSFQKQNCLCVLDKLAERGYSLQSVQCLNYVDRYTIATADGQTATVDCQYNGAGQYTSRRLQKGSMGSDELCAIFDNDSQMRYAFNYTPSDGVFRQLHEKMKSLCDDLLITITNVEERLPQWYVTYHLKASGRYARVQFYFGTNGSITYAMPASDLGAADEKLQQLIIALQ